MKLDDARSLARSISSGAAMIEAIDVSFSRPIDVVADRRQHDAHACGAITSHHGLARRQAERQRGLALAAVDRLDAGAEDLGQHGAALQAEADRPRR